MGGLIPHVWAAELRLMDVVLDFLNHLGVRKTVAISENVRSLVIA